MSRLEALDTAARVLFEKGNERDAEGNFVLAGKYYNMVEELIKEGLIIASGKEELTRLEKAIVEELKRLKGLLREVSQDAGKSNPTSVTSAQFERRIEGEIMQKRDDTTFKDIAGMKHVKIALTEMVILPSVRSDIYTGIRTPPRGLLLFGPPGNGKTFIARAVANEVNATFFSISATAFASSLVGDAENLLRALFTVARRKQPSLIFIDEIDSILTKRCDNDQEHARKLKTEFLVQFDGVGTDRSDNVTIIGATNLPSELDEAALRRFEKKIYVGLPDYVTRKQLLDSHLRQKTLPNRLHQEQVKELVANTRGYSASDLKNLCREAAMMPLRNLGGGILRIRVDSIPEVTYSDFNKAKVAIKPSVGKSNLEKLERWNAEFGSIPNVALT